MQHAVLAVTGVWTGRDQRGGSIGYVIGKSGLPQLVELGNRSLLLATSELKCIGKRRHFDRERK